MKNCLIIFIIFLSLISCKDKISQSSDLKNLSQEKSEKLEIENFNFPDTVSVNTMIKGRIKYNRNFEDVDDSKIKERYVFFHVGTDQNSENLSLNKFDKFPYRLAFEDTVGNGIINFETVFTKAGINYLHGIVKDMYKIEASNKSNDSVEVSIKETVITKKVFVLDK